MHIRNVFIFVDGLPSSLEVRLCECYQLIFLPYNGA
jgi:hypothetical protein